MKFLILSFAAICCILNLIQMPVANAQQTVPSLQDTTSINRQATAQRQKDTRLVGAASVAANLLLDSGSYNTKKGLPVTQLFNADDLSYFSKGGLSYVVALFEEVNRKLPKGKKLEFITDSTQSSVSPQAAELANNPLVLNDLRMRISASPAAMSANRPQWQENVFQAYLARAYGSKLENTITITSATREIREEPQLEILDVSGSPVTLIQILKSETAKNPVNAEQRAVSRFRELTFPNGKISKAVANENYRRALLALINLQEGDFNRHQETRQLLNQLANDLRLGNSSKVLTALKGSTFFDQKAPGNIGPVLVTEADVVNPLQIAANAKDKAMELMTLTALHYGERDAVKLFQALLNGSGGLTAASTNIFTQKRLDQLSYHGTAQIKSLGIVANPAGMSIADLALVAVAAPAPPQSPAVIASLSLSEVGQTVMSTYITTEVIETKTVFQLNPRVSLGSRYMTYAAANDPLYYANSIVSHTGAELRLESDLYLANLEKMLASGKKPFIYPEFGVILGSGQRKVGYEGNRQSAFGELPKFKQNYLNWGGHLGLNVGPVLIGMDATVLSTKSAGDAYSRFLDLSQAMTYYRYSFLTRVLNLDLGKKNNPNPYYLTFDVEVAGETNNEGTQNKTRTQNGTAQIASSEWQRAYDKARPNGVYNMAIAKQMILDGSVKASYPSANYAAIHLGLIKSAFMLKITAGLYNRMAIDGYGDGKSEWLNKLAKNTFNGSGFAAATVTYNFGTFGASRKTKHTTKQSVINGIDSGIKTEDTESNSRVHAPLRTRAIFMNRN